MCTKEFHYYCSSGRVGGIRGRRLFTHSSVTLSFVGYCRSSPLSQDFKNGIEAYGVLVELGVQFYGLYMWYFALVSVCLPLRQCFSTAGPRPGTGPREVLLEFVILVF